MIDYKGASIKELFFQKIEEEATEHHLVQNEFSPSEEEMLKSIFLKPFTDTANTYQFTHNVDLELNVLYNLSK